MKMKNGINLLEILASIVIVAYLTSLGMKTQSEKDFLNEVDSTITKISSIVSLGIYDTFKGYTTAGGGNCSSAYDVINISAKRVKLCTQIPFELVDETTGDDTDGTKSYFTFLDSKAKDTHGCRVYVADSDAYTTRLLINCSGMDSKYYSMLEQKISKQLSKQLPLVYKNTYSKAIDYININSGTETDGILIAEFQK